MAKRAFISHVTEEAETAAKLKAALNRDFLRLLDVFVSSDGESISAGDDWLQSITSSEAVTLVAALAKLIKENKGKPRTSLSELLARLQIDALRVSSDIETKLQLLLEKLRDLGLDPDKSLESQIEDLTWYNWIRHAQLKSYREEFHAAYRQLTSFIDDATAVLLCEGSREQASGLKTAMFAEAYKKKRVLDTVIMDSGRTLGGMLRTLLSTARQVTEDLRAA
jgi:hypothetical protein